MHDSQAAKQDALDNLCIYDPRSSSYADQLWAYEHEPEEIPEPRKGCGCDNCFYGRDRLASRLLLALNRLEAHQYLAVAKFL